QDIISNALELAKGYEGSNNLYIRILSIIPLTVSNIAFIENQDEDIKDEYWKNPFRIFGVKDQKVIDFVLENSSKYGAYYNIITMLFENRSIISADETLNYMNNVIGMINQQGVTLTSHDSWQIQEIIESVQQELKGQYDKYPDLMTVEIILNKVISWDNMLCTQYMFKTNAKYYAEIIGNVLKNDSSIEPTEEKLECAKKLFSLYYDTKFCPGEINNEIDENILKKWVSDFSEILRAQHQGSIITHELGRLFAFSPIGNDGCYPHEEIRDIIENIYDEGLCNSYGIAIRNKRGVHTCDAGESENELAIRNKENANKIRIKYPKTAEIYDKISHSYSVEAKAEREREENGRW
ncbi:MAG: hypothetical protein PHV32_10630, partial [Eubacteriales bacterium]|nr:hypothetical protein [Eubacteriales bacterium]